MLFRETRQLGLYGTFLAAPALIIHGYQRLLTLAGKDPDSAFPDGTWQFYTEFGLRAMERGYSATYSRERFGQFLSRHAARAFAHAGAAPSRHIKQLACSRWFDGCSVLAAVEM